MKNVKDQNKTIEKLDARMATMADNFNKLTNQVTNQISQSNEASSMIKVMWQNQYGDKLLNDVPVHQLSKYEVEILMEQSLSSLRVAHIFQKVDILEKEVSALKYENFALKESPNSMSVKMDEHANTTGEVLLVQQQMLNQMM